MKQKYHSMRFCAVFIFFSITLGAQQTVHIDPTGGGGFELINPSTNWHFPINHWEYYSPYLKTKNQWTIGTKAGGTSGTIRAAYVTNDRAAIPQHPYSYSSAATATHFYKDVEILPLHTQIELSFKWKCTGNSNDGMRVWLVPITFSPTNGMTITANGTAPTGRIRIGLAHYSNSLNWSNASITIPSVYAGTTFRLAVEWRNDDSTANQSPIAIDDISLISRCAGKTWNGSANTDWNNANNWTPFGVPTNLNCVTIPT